MIDDSYNNYMKRNQNKTSSIYLREKDFLVAENNFLYRDELKYLLISSTLYNRM